MATSLRLAPHSVRIGSYGKIMRWREFALERDLHAAQGARARARAAQAQSRVGALSFFR